MIIDIEGRRFNCALTDDGSLDTVFTINGREYRFDSEYVARVPSGYVPAHEIERICRDLIDENWDELTGENNA